MCPLPVVVWRLTCAGHHLLLRVGVTFRAGRAALPVGRDGCATAGAPLRGRVRDRHFFRFDEDEGIRVGDRGSGFGTREIVRIRQRGSGQVGMLVTGVGRPGECRRAPALRYVVVGSDFRGKMANRHPIPEMLGILATLAILVIFGWVKRVRIR